MMIGNIIKKLSKDGYQITLGEFDFKKCYMVNGTALIDLVDGTTTETNAKYSDVILQIDNNRSHIQTISDKKKELTSYNKLGY